MKKLIMMMAMAVGFTVFADSQNDKLISFSTSGTSYYQDGLTKIVDNECVALIWIKDGESFGGFNANGTLKDETNNKLVRVVNLAKDGHCPPITFVIPAGEVEGIYAGGSFVVYLLDTRDGNGQPTVAQNNTVGRVNWFGKCDDSSAEVDAAVDVAKVFNSYVCTYADGKPVLEGERCVLVQSDENGVFCGITWQGVPEDAVVDTFTADASGKFNINLDNVTSGKNYELIVLDSRIPDGSVLASKLGENLVSAFGEFMLNSDGTAIDGINWKAVKMGLSATYPVLKHAFSFDPALNLENGYAVVSPEDGKWQVYKLPEAWVASYESPEFSLKGGTYWHLGKNKNDIPDPFKLESAYKFSAFDIKYEEKALAYLRGDYSKLEAPDYQLLDDWNKQVAPFKEWNADFEVSFDRPVAANSVLLAGFYNYTSAWAGKYTFDWVGEGQKDPWVGSSPEKDLAAGEVTRLLYSYIGKSGNVTMTYDEICQKVIQFFCGVKNLSEKNYGTTMTVKLCIYENTGRCHESGSKIVIGTYRYTFMGPLYVNYNKSLEGNEPAGAEMPANLETNTDGRTSFPLSVPTYDHKTYKDIAFVGWSNQVAKVTYSEIPTNTWSTADEPIELYAVWKAAKSTKVTVADEKTSVESDIKVTDEWLVKNDIDPTSENLQAELEKPQGDAGRPVWQNYLLGMDPNADLKVEKTNGNEDDKALVVSTVQVVAPDAGIKVGYSLDKVGSDEKEVTKEGETQATKDLKIDLEPISGETPTGYYKMNVIFTPTKDGVDQSDIKIPADNTIGVLKVESEEKLVPVAVPWTSLNSKGSVAVDEIVKTSTLSEEDKMHVYDSKNGAYHNYQLKGGEWQWVDSYELDANGVVTQVPATKPSDEKIARGSSVWLERSDVTKPFYLIGEYDSNSGCVVTVSGADSVEDQERPAYNLIAPVGIEQTDLNEVPSLKAAAQDAKSANDQIVIMRDGVYTRFIPHEGSWGYNKAVIKSVGTRTIKTIQFVKDDTKVDAGLGMWYIRKDKSDLDITWKQSNETPAQ